MSGPSAYSIDSVALTLPELRERYRPLSDQKIVPVSPLAGNTTFEVREPTVEGESASVVMNVGSRSLRVSPGFLTAVASDLGMGSKYFKHTPLRMLLPHIEWWYGEESGHPDFRVLAREFTENGETAEYALEFLRPSALPVPFDEVISTVDAAAKDVMGGGAPGYRLGWSDGFDRVTFAVVNPDDRHTVSGSSQVNDVLYTGAMIDFSPTGRYPMRVRSYVERLVCLNGMTKIDHVVNYEALGDIDPASWLSDTIPMVFGQGRGYFEQADRMAGTPVAESDLGVTIDDLFENLGVRGRSRTEVVSHLASTNTETMWDVMNAFTYVGTHSPNIGLGQRVDLLASGGDVPQHVERCEECRHLLR